MIKLKSIIKHNNLIVKVLMINQKIKKNKNKKLLKKMK